MELGGCMETRKGQRDTVIRTQMATEFLFHFSFPPFHMLWLQGEGL